MPAIKTKPRSNNARKKQRPTRSVKPAHPVDFPTRFGVPFTAVYGLALRHRDAFRSAVRSMTARGLTRADAIRGLQPPKPRKGTNDLAAFIAYHASNFAFGNPTISKHEVQKSLSPELAKLCLDRRRELRSNCFSAARQLIELNREKAVSSAE